MLSSKLSRESLLTNNNLFFTPLKCSHSIFCLMNSPKLPALFPVNCSLSFRKIVFISNNNFISTLFTCLPASFYQIDIESKRYEGSWYNSKDLLKNVTQQCSILQVLANQINVCDEIILAYIFRLLKAVTLDLLPHKKI